MDRRQSRSKGMEQTEALSLAFSETPQAVFEALYRSSCDDVYAYVAGVLRDRAAAEDVTAAAFERAYRKRASYKPGHGTHRAWLFGIARNAALDELRRRKRVTPSDVEPVDEAATAQIESADTALKRASIRRALGTLTGRERELIALKFYGGLSNAEVAAVTGTTESNAGTFLHRTITKLRKACDETA